MLRGGNFECIHVDEWVQDGIQEVLCEHLIGSICGCLEILDSLFQNHSCRGVYRRNFKCYLFILFAILRILKRYVKGVKCVAKISSINIIFSSSLI